MRRREKLDAHCWMYYIVKFGCDYTLPNRRRLENSKYVFARAAERAAEKDRT